LTHHHGSYLVINLQKTKEMVFHHPNPQNIVYPAPFDGIDRVQVAKFLGVFLQSNFSYEKHVKYILTACSASEATALWRYRSLLLLLLLLCIDYNVLKLKVSLYTSI